MAPQREDHQQPTREETRREESRSTSASKGQQLPSGRGEARSGRYSGTEPTQTGFEDERKKERRANADILAETQDMVCCKPGVSALKHQALQ